MTSQLLAHAGHGTTASGPMHYVAEPIHALPLFAVAGFVAIVAIALWRFRASRQAALDAGLEVTRGH